MIPAALVLVAIVAAAVPSGAAVTEEEVGRACSRSVAALDTYQEARSAFADASYELEQTNLDLAAAQERKTELDRLLAETAFRADETTAVAEAAAAELYMNSFSGRIRSFMGTDRVSNALVVGAALEEHTREELAAIDSLAALRNELDRLESAATEASDQLAGQAQRQAAFTADQQSAMADATEAYAHLDEECRDLQSQYEAEQARLQALEEQRRRDEEKRRQAQEAEEDEDTTGGGGSTGGNGPGIVCPFERGKTQFIDSWGFARSGGRGHQGTDMMAAWDEPVYAVEPGTILEADEHGIGGRHVWLQGTSGVGYYYAHLNSLLVPDGATVSQGQQIGTNGDSGNAAGGAPHVHLQIHPSGRSGSPINPYPQVAAACF